MKKDTKKSYLEILLHIGIWLLVYALPFLFSWKNADINLSERLLHHAVVTLSFMTVFYINYFVLIDNYLFHKKILKFILTNIILIAIVGIAVHLWIESSKLVNLDMPVRNISRTWPFFIRDLISLFMIAGLGVALKTTGKWYRLEADKKEEDKKRTEAELLTLRQQINPHFLFNTLNNIYALIEISPEKAQNVVHELSKLMRYVLYENSGDKVELNKELLFLKNYIELMKIRLTDDVKLSFINKVPENNKWEIPPMLFVTLVENAFKHGISPTKESFINIVFDVIDNNKFACTIHNSYFPKSDTDLAGSGIGLENLKRRLEILYPENHEIYAGEIDGVYYSRIVIPIMNDLA